MFAEAVSICCSPLVVRRASGNLASTFLPRSIHWMLDLLYTVNLVCLVISARAPFEKSEPRCVPSRAFEPLSPFPSISPS